MKITKQIIEEYAKAELKKELRATKAVITNKPINGYLGWTGFGNLGDEAVLEAYQKLFASSDLKPFRIGRPTTLVADMLHRNVPVGFAGLGGGTLINQTPAWLEQCNYLLAKNVPMFCLGTGVASRSFWKDREDVHKADSLEAWAETLSKFVYAGVRGPMSQAHLKSVGLDVDIVGDAALALADDDYVVRTGRKIVGINVSGGTEGGMWGDARTMAKEMTAFVAQLVKEGFEVRMLPIWKGDLALCREIATEVANPSCHVVEAYRTTEQYMAEQAKCDLFIGLKLHATILATMLRVPSIMLEYRPKCLDYMKSVNMADYSVRTDEVTAAGMRDKLQLLIENYETIVTTLDERVLHYKRLQEEKAQYILQQVQRTA